MGKRIYPDTPWVYYLSRNRFMCVYPFIPFDGFFMDDAFYGMDLFERGRPANNQERNPYITDVYVDEAGKGLMITVGAPVYRDGHFMGIVGFDLTLAALSRSLQLRQFPGDELYLVNAIGEVIGLTGAGHPAEDAIPQNASLSKLSPGLFEFAKAYPLGSKPTVFDDAWVHVLRLPDVDWMLIVERPTWRVYRSAAYATLPLIAFLVVMLSGMIAFLKEKQRQREMESKKSLKRFRRLLDSSTDMIAVIDSSSGRI